jgi:hypothetical protein
MADRPSGTGFFLKRFYKGFGNQLRLERNTKSEYSKFAKKRILKNRELEPMFDKLNKLLRTSNNGYSSCLSELRFAQEAFELAEQINIYLNQKDSKSMWLVQKFDLKQGNKESIAVQAKQIANYYHYLRSTLGDTLHNLAKAQPAVEKLIKTRKYWIQINDDLRILETKSEQLIRNPTDAKALLSRMRDSVIVLENMSAQERNDLDIAFKILQDNTSEIYKINLNFKKWKHVLKQLEKFPRDTSFPGQFSVAADAVRIIKITEDELIGGKGSVRTYADSVRLGLINSFQTMHKYNKRIKQLDRELVALIRTA